jgi:chemotaxis protein methyltransferase CheR
MTTNETSWFRDKAPYECFKKFFLPDFAKQMKEKGKTQIRIWSAACSTGQEPYSISMLCHEYARMGFGGKELAQGGLKILASDISPSVLFLAKNGRYDGLSMSRGMPDELKQQYFEESGRVFVLKDQVKQMVDFQQVNLMNSFDPLGKFDLILLRNVAIYFSKEVKIELFKKLAKALNPGGYLLVGASESLIGYSHDFDARLEHDYNFYQLKS